MIAKKYKLPVQESYGRRGQTKRSGRFLLKIFPAQLSYPRFGVVISRKVAAKATARNRLKRLFFNFIRANLKQLPVGDYLVIFNPAAAKCAPEELTREFRELML